MLGKEKSIPNPWRRPCYLCDPVVLLTATDYLKIKILLRGQAETNSELPVSQQMVVAPDLIQGQEKRIGGKAPNKKRQMADILSVYLPLQVNMTHPKPLSPVKYYVTAGRICGSFPTCKLVIFVWLRKMWLLIYLGFYPSDDDTVDWAFNVCAGLWTAKTLA